MKETCGGERKKEIKMERKERERTNITADHRSQITERGGKGEKKEKGEGETNGETKRRKERKTKEKIKERTKDREKTRAKEEISGK